MSRTKAEFRALRETLGITQAHMADYMGVKVLSVKRWESPKYPQQAPEEAWDILDGLMDVQDDATAAALAQVNKVVADHGRYPDEVVLPYWSSQADYESYHYDPEDESSWTEVNATNRRIFLELRSRGIGVRWVDGSDNIVPTVE